MLISAKSLSETHSISANVEFPWLAGRFPPARHSGAAKIRFIPGQIVLYFTKVRVIGSFSVWAELVEHHECLISALTVARNSLASLCSSPLGTESFFMM